MSMTEQITQAISRVPAASALDGDAVNAIARAVLTELLNPTQYMLVHADDNTAFIAEGRVVWFKTVIEAALLEMDQDEEERSFMQRSSLDIRAIEANMVETAGLATEETWPTADCLNPPATLKEPGAQ